MPQVGGRAQGVACAAYRAKFLFRVLAFKSIKNGYYRATVTPVRKQVAKMPAKWYWRLKNRSPKTWIVPMALPLPYRSFFIMSGE